MLALCSGCGTYMAHEGAGGNLGAGAGLYSGVYCDAMMVGYSCHKNPEVHWPQRIYFFCYFIDIPLSAVVDTFYLPFDLAKDNPQSK